MKKGLPIVLALLLLPFTARAAVFHPETFTLDNGLQVVVVPNHLAPAVTQMVWYKAGSTDEKPGKTGLAHYLEHLMFRGTKDVPPGEFSKRIAAQGGNDNAFTSYDYTAFYETVAADRLPMVMRMEADRMQNLQIVPETAKPELKVVLDEQQERTANNPEGLFEQRLRHLLMPHYPYGVPVIGWRPEIEKLTARDARRFYQDHYAPNNAVVIISGDVDADQVKQLAQSTYGKIPRKKVTPRRVFPALDMPKTHDFVMTDARVEQSELEFDVVMPSYSTQKDHEAYALEVLSEALDGGEVGLLYRHLAVEQGLASAIETNYDPDARGDTLFTIDLIPQPDQDPNTLARALREELQILVRTGIDAKTVDEAKRRLEHAAIFERDSLEAPGFTFGEALTTGHKVDDVEEWPGRIEAVTPAEVNAALHALEANPHYILGMLLPNPHATPEEREKARQPSLQHNESIR